MFVSFLAVAPQEVCVRDLLRCLVATCVPGAAPPSLQAASILALGHTHPSNHDVSERLMGAN